MGLLIFDPAKADRRATIVSLIIAFGTATFFYKFGSFALECLAFLATWFVIDVPLQWLARHFTDRPQRKHR
ncbi:MAG: hypothetical protein M3177_07630 [Pseudomonadota bacterium]|nr:hypothetical protein [Pseudomonadota bacterium]